MDGKDTSCKAECNSRVNIQINLEAFLQRHQVFALCLERPHITPFVLVLPLCIPEKKPCELLAVFIVTKAGSSVEKGPLQCLSFRCVSDVTNKTFYFEPKTAVHYSLAKCFGPLMLHDQASV
jgi:hypothetical protein